MIVPLAERYLFDFTSKRGDFIGIRGDGLIYATIFSLSAILVISIAASVFYFLFLAFLFALTEISVPFK